MAKKAYFGVGAGKCPVRMRRPGIARLDRGPKYAHMSQLASHGMAKHVPTLLPHPHRIYRAKVIRLIEAGENVR